MINSIHDYPNPSNPNPPIPPNPPNPNHPIPNGVRTSDYRPKEREMLASVQEE
jgi:hypothetical protein